MDRVQPPVTEHLLDRLPDMISPAGAVGDDDAAAVSFPDCLRQAADQRLLTRLARTQAAFGYGELPSKPGMLILLTYAPDRHTAAEQELN
jgi:hypothetical protein